MSSIVEQFGTATVLLFSGNHKSERPSKRRLRELLNAPDIQIYSGMGVHRGDINQLNLALQIAENGRSTRSIDYLHAAISRSVIVPKGLEILEFSESLLAAFTIDQKSMKHLHLLIIAWVESQCARASADSWIRAARENAERLRKIGLQDATVTGVDEKVLSELGASYGVEAERYATEFIKAWVAKNSWTRAAAPLSQLD